MKTLYRSQRDKKIFGLCGGLAEAMNVDATLLRLVAVATAFFSSGAFVLLYIVAGLVVPKEPVFEETHSTLPTISGQGAAAMGSATREAYGAGLKQEAPPARAEEVFNLGHSWSTGSHRTTEQPGEIAKMAEAGGGGEQPAANTKETTQEHEVKALWKELETLREKLAKYEAQQGNTKERNDAKDE
ncbi:PspC domain-containing protein [Paenibacillus turpanensis]|uniref:PspC domain-containing protein n=1 Tax=Paenibacillus turpanensis TaxID=2689078 RepID=UPI00140CEB60|nr:PspC domain-containing protein [Paenibacillus turpanensis]